MTSEHRLLCIRVTGVTVASQSPKLSGLGANPRWPAIMKVCCSCRIAKSSDKFYSNKTKADGLQPSCIDCKKIYNQAHYKKDIEAYKKRNKAHNARSRAEFRLWMVELKSKPCTDCKETYHPCQMDFDHVRGEKEFEIGQAACLSRERVEQEIQKCELVCANCHRLRTYKRNNER